MRGPSVHPVVIAAGGTGGHFFPAEALAGALIARGVPIVLMTDARSGALRSAVFAGHECHILPGAGIAGRGVVKGVQAAFALARGVIKARKLLREVKPSVIVAFGGYPSVPPVLAASMMPARPKIVLQEQNAVLGRANRLLARFADAIALGFAGTEKLPAKARHVVTGNPVRPVIAELADTPYTLPKAVFNLLVVGGSLGARVFSDVVPEALTSLPPYLAARLRVAQQCRAEDLDRVRNAYAAAGISAELAPFFKDMDLRYAAAHLVVGRAGASTCAELAVVGRPSILVPLPGAIDDHQSANARALAACGAATVLPQADFTPGRLAPLIMDAMTEPEHLRRAAEAAHSCAHPRAAADLADLVESLMPEGVP
jgi:UDP-N-acetylglucosamine--N-acetylmuramyl-(pentapeptide) pyrophosphoryl-undecaprenol N-acetylglucosamine transferase